MCFHLTTILREDPPLNPALSVSLLFYCVLMFSAACGCLQEKKAQVSRDLDSCDKSVQAWLKRTRTQRQRHQRATKQSIGLDESKGSRLAALKRIMQTAARGRSTVKEGYGE